MDKSEQERWHDVICWHWWPKGNHEIAKSIIDKFVSIRKKSKLKCLDVGCSGGVIADYLKTFGKSYGIDKSLEGLYLKKIENVFSIQSDAIQMPFKNELFDIITLLDVAEHVENDLSLFREIYRVSKRTGLLFVMVPAHSCLWGSHDVRYGHKRRYSKRDITILADKTGFFIERLTYLHPYVFPVMYFVRFIDRKRNKCFGVRDDFISFGTFLDRFFLWVLLFESYVVKYVNFPIGTSLFAILRKK